MKRFLLVTGSMAAVTVALFIGYLFSSNFWDNLNPFMKPHMWEVTKSWTGVPELPADATEFQIKTSGDFLTRKFESSFSAPASRMKAWLAAIPDFDKMEVEELPNGEIEHVGRGRNGATYFKLHLNRDKSSVRLFVSWN